MPFRSTATALVLSALSLSILCQRGFSQGGLDQAEPIGSFLNGLLPSETPRTASGNWALNNAFPNLTFVDPIQMIPVPGTNQLLIVDRNGRLAVIENDPTTASKTILLDISNQVESAHDSGMLGAAFHPEFGQPGSPNRDHLYLYFRASPNDAETDLAYCRLSRFTWQAGSPAIDLASEFILINQYDRNNWHNGGGLFFGADGFLYLSIGDEGGANDQFQSGQKTNLGLFAGVLRIDVDQDLTRSHPIRRQPVNPDVPPLGWPDSFSQGYTIPDDNPWLSPDGSELEEFYAIGLRSPHRMTLDPVTNHIWVGDVGQGGTEEVSLIEKGANLQWPYREGDTPGPKTKPNPLQGFDQVPVWDYHRDQGGCVIGGYVYRGSAFPDLYGKYLVGDYNNGAIRALTYTPGQAPEIEDLVTLVRHGPGPQNGLSSFGIDAQGEIYVLSMAGADQDGGIIYKLGRNGPAVGEPPALLSQTGAFQDLANLIPNPGVIPYDLIQPLWSDGAAKQRWIAIPNDGTPDSPAEQIAFSENGEWSFPIGTVLIKHFGFNGRRLETRFLVRGTDGQYYGVTYRWRPDQSDADLLPGAPLDETIDLGGGQSLDWHFPGRTECFSCHTQASGIVLGPKTRHLNRDLFYPATGRSANQLSTLNQLGFFSPAPDELDIPGFLTAANVADPGETLDRRARSYLDINCSQCHRPGGPTQAAFSALLTTPPFFQNQINVDPGNDLGVANAKIIKPDFPEESVLQLRVNSLGGCCAMPPLAKNAVDAVAVQTLTDWILSLDPLTVPTGPVADPAPADYSLPEPQLSIPGGNTNPTGPFQVDLAFAEPVVGVTLADFTVVNGSTSNLGGSGANYSLTIWPAADGPGSVFLPGDSVTDPNGNANPPSNTLEFTAVNLPPPTTEPGLRYDYYQGAFTELPDFSAFAPDKSGTVANFSLSPRLREDNYAFRFLGDLNIVTAGDYTFHLSSDDGSQLLLYGATVIDNDGVHGTITMSATVTLDVGIHPLEVDFFETFGNANLTVEIEGPGLARQPLPDSLLSHRIGGNENQPPVFAAIPVQSVAVNQPVTLNLTATDPDNDPLIFSASGLPVGLSINPATGAITGTPTAPAFYFVTVSADDGRGGADTESFTWIVNNPSGSAQPGIFYEYFHGAFDQLPDFSLLTPVQTGVIATIDLSPRIWLDNFAFRFLGNLGIAVQGDYTFYLSSDDGSRLWINDVLVVDNDGRHGTITESGAIALGIGTHALEVGFFERTGSAILTVEIEGPGLPRQPIPATFLSHGGIADGNFPPKLSAIPDRGDPVNVPVTLTVEATDPNEDSLTFSATGLPFGLLIDSATGEISGTPLVSSDFNVTVAVEDGNGASDSESFTWSITGAGGRLPGIRYDYYEQEFTQLPDFSTLTPVLSGVVPQFTLTPRLRNDAFAFRFLGEISIPASGDYTFRLTSDDGSRLWIDGGLVVDNDGSHSPFEQIGTVNLAAGIHAIEVGFFEEYGGELLIVEIEGPGLPRQLIPAAMLIHPSPGGSETGNDGSGGGSFPNSAAQFPGSGTSSDFSRRRFRYQPDNWIGTRLRSQRGDNIYNTSGRSQTVSLKLPNHRTRSFFFTVQNDRRVPDSLVVRASRQDKKFKLTYLKLGGKTHNISGAISVNGFGIASLPVDARLIFQTRVKASRKLKTRRGLRRLSILSTSTFEGLGQDRIKAILRKSK